MILRSISYTQMEASRELCLSLSLHTKKGKQEKRRIKYQLLNGLFFPNESKDYSVYFVLYLCLVKISNSSTSELFKINQKGWRPHKKQTHLYHIEAERKGKSRIKSNITKILINFAFLTKYFIATFQNKDCNVRKLLVEKRKS